MLSLCRVASYCYLLLLLRVVRLCVVFCVGMCSKISIPEGIPLRSSIDGNET